jgi:DNA repair ATPase RecN
MPKDLLSVEEALQFLAAALKASVQPGLDKVEVQRLNAVANLAKKYKEILADYINYREIEEQMAEMSEKYEGLVESYKMFSSKPDEAKKDEFSDQEAE